MPGDTRGTVFSDFTLHDKDIVIKYIDIDTHPKEDMHVEQLNKTEVIYMNT